MKHQTQLWVLQTDAFIFCLPRELLQTVTFQSGSFEQESLPWYTVKLLSHPPFRKAEKNMSYLFFSVKTYGPIHFELKTKA